MYQESSTASKQRLRMAFSAALSAVVALVFCPRTNAQASSFVPTRPNAAIVSVRDLQIPPKAKKEMRRGLQRLEKQDPAGSLKHFASAIRISPDYFEAYYDEGVAQSQMQRNDEALRSFEQAISLSEGRYTRAEFGYALILCREGNPAEAERVARHGLQTDDNIADGHVVLAVALLKQDRFSEAEAAAREALRFNQPEAIKASLVLADVHAAQGNYEEQVRDLDAFLRRHTNDLSSNFLRASRDVAAKMAMRKRSQPASALSHSQP